MSLRQASVTPRNGGTILNWIQQVRSGKPVVCAINGASIGPGMTRILPCDVRIAFETARFSMRFVRAGIVPEITSTKILPQLVGLREAIAALREKRSPDFRSVR